MRPTTLFTKNLRGPAILQRAAVAAVACVILAVGCTFAGSPATDGIGWTVTRLDLEVRVTNDAPSMAMGGTRSSPRT